MVAGYKYLDLQAMSKAWREFTWGAWGWLLLLPALYLAFKSLRFTVLMRPVSKAPARDIVAGYAASQAASLLPGGVAMRAAMMHRVGVPVEVSSGPILANSGMDQFVLLLGGLALGYYYPELRTSAFILTAILLVLVALLAFAPTRLWIRARLEGFANRFDHKDKVSGFCDRLPELLDARVFVQALLWSILANAVSLSVLCVVVYYLGFPVDPWPLAAAFVIPNLLGRLSPLPAGAGVVEAGMVGFMAAQTPMSYDQAAVATVLYRIADVVVPALYGALCHALFFKERPLETVGVAA